MGILAAKAKVQWNTMQIQHGYCFMVKSPKLHKAPAFKRLI